MIDAKGMSMNHILGGQMYDQQQHLGSDQRIRIEDGEEDGGQSTARYLAPPNEDYSGGDDKAQSSFGKQPYQFLSGPQQERVNTLGDAGGGISIYQNQRDVQSEIMENGSSLKKARKSDAREQIEMYTDTVQRNVFADMNQLQNSRLSPDKNSQFVSVIKLKEESDKDELQKYIDQFYKGSKVYSQQPGTFQNSNITSNDQQSEINTATKYSQIYKPAGGKTGQNKMMSESLMSTSSYPKSSKLIQQLLNPNLTADEKSKIQEKLLNASEKSLSPDQRQYLKNELRRHKNSLEKSEKMLSRQQKNMSPIKMSIPHGILIDEQKNNSRDEFILHMQKLQSSSKKLTPEGFKYLESGQTDQIQSKQTLGLLQSLQSSGPYNYLQWSKEQTPDKLKRQESQLKMLLERNDPDLLGLLSQQTSTFEQKQSSRDQALFQAFNGLPQQENINPVEEIQAVNNMSGLSSNHKQSTLASAHPINPRMSLLNYTEEQKMQTGLQPLAKLTNFAVNSMSSSNAAPVPQLSLPNNGVNFNIPQLNGHQLGEIHAAFSGDTNHTFRNQNQQSTLQKQPSNQSDFPYLVSKNNDIILQNQGPDIGMGQIPNHPLMQILQSPPIADDQASRKSPYMQQNVSHYEVPNSDYGPNSQPQYDQFMDAPNNSAQGYDSGAKTQYSELEQIQQQNHMNNFQYQDPSIQDGGEATNIQQTSSVLQRQALNDNMYLEQFKENHQARSLVDMEALSRGYIQPDPMIIASAEMQLQNLQNVKLAAATPPSIKQQPVSWRNTNPRVSNPFTVAENSTLEPHYNAETKSSLKQFHPGQVGEQMMETLEPDQAWQKNDQVSTSIPSQGGTMHGAQQVRSLSLFRQQQQTVNQSRQQSRILKHPPRQQRAGSFSGKQYGTSQSVKSFRTIGPTAGVPSTSRNPFASNASSFIAPRSGGGDFLRKNTGVNCSTGRVPSQGRGPSQTRGQNQSRPKSAYLKALSQSNMMRSKRTVASTQNGGGSIGNQQRGTVSGGNHNSSIGTLKSPKPPLKSLNSQKLQTGTVIQRIQSTQGQVMQILTGNANGTSGLLKFKIQGKTTGLYEGEPGSTPGGVIITGDQVYEVVNKLITCEKLMDSLHGPETIVKGHIEVDSEEIVTMYLNSFLLLLVYNRNKDYGKIIKYLDQNYASGITFKEHIEKLGQKDQIASGLLQNYCLHIMALVADSFMQAKHFQKSSQAFFNLCKVYNRWKVKNTGRVVAKNDPSTESINVDFGTDDYILSKANYSECLWHNGQLKHAIAKFESTKRQIENEIVYENPVLFVNVCYKLGSCWLQQAKDSGLSADDPARQSMMTAAMDNFESALCLINRMSDADAQISLKVKSKICLNIGLIRSHFDSPMEAIIMLQQALEFKKAEVEGDDQSRGSNSMVDYEELRDQYVLLAHQQQKLFQYASSIKSLEAALELQTQQHGEYDYKTCQILTQIAHIHLKSEQYSESIGKLERSVVILARIETMTHEAKTTKRSNVANISYGIDSGRISEKLDQLYLQLADLYMTVEKQNQCQSILDTLEQRLEQAAENTDYPYGIMNEIANILRKHESFDLASQFYKKALLCIKRRYKSEYLHQFSTSQILSNLATVQYLLQNLPEALKYYKHALEVIKKLLKAQKSPHAKVDYAPLPLLNRHELLDLFMEQGKIHMSLASVYKDLDGENNDSNNFILSESHESEWSEQNQDAMSKKDSHKQYQAAIIAFQKFLDEIQLMRDDVHNKKFTQVDPAKLTAQERGSLPVVEKMLLEAKFETRPNRAVDQRIVSDIVSQHQTIVSQHQTTYVAENASTYSGRAKMAAHMRQQSN